MDIPTKVILPLWQRHLNNNATNSLSPLGATVRRVTGGAK
jgi:hypothetical protein